MTIPVRPTAPIAIYTGHTGKLGTWTFTAAVGDFTGTRILVKFGNPDSPALTLDSDVPGDGLSWSGGVLDDLTITPAQAATVYAAEGALVTMRITLEEAAPSTESHLFGIADIRISEAG